MKINKQWHEANLMPKNPTIEQRIAWHVQHQQACGCREVPETIKAEIKKRKIQY